MTNKFAELTAFIPRIKNDTYGEWIIDHENDGTPEHPKQMPFVHYSEVVVEFVDTLYKYCDAHPEFEHTKYGETLDRLRNQLGSTSFEEADVSNMDAKK